jgi:uncharacterized membrane-anchored protein YhcB (DUF1043 family)
MSINPQVDQIATADPRLDAMESVVPELRTEPVGEPGPERTAEVTAPAVEPAAWPAGTDGADDTAAPARARPRWVVPAAIAAIGLIASGALGYLFYSTSSRLDATSHELAATQASLESTRQQVTSLQADAASKKVTADYLRMYVADSGKVLTDYGQVVDCQTYTVCRTAAQQTLTDMQAFQSDRQSTTVPVGLNSSDGELGDSLSAGIAAVQELIEGMDNNSKTKIDDGFTKLNGAVLNMGKAETALGSEIR